ncbi:uncharacterized protein LOC133030595 [Cannabis sativa]|uniref:uncharacterized protein LOC133030595 n=1 Tax=Cannabis sativa TaxID=3483 RepID=UPI0029CA82CF|nr:uncharacterized protein LOC133030595 [Cannabis sativa]
MDLKGIAKKRMYNVADVVEASGSKKRHLPSKVEARKAKRIKSLSRLRMSSDKFEDFDIPKKILLRNEIIYMTKKISFLQKLSPLLPTSLLQHQVFHGLLLREVQQPKDVELRVMIRGVIGLDLALKNTGRYDEFAWGQSSFELTISSLKVDGLKLKIDLLHTSQQKISSDLVELKEFVCAQFVSFAAQMATMQTQFSSVFADSIAKDKASDSSNNDGGSDNEEDIDSEDEDLDEGSGDEEEGSDGEQKDEDDNEDSESKGKDDKGSDDECDDSEKKASCTYKRRAPLAQFLLSENYSQGQSFSL